jgi:hypothetical protein
MRGKGLVVAWLWFRWVVVVWSARVVVIRSLCCCGVIVAPPCCRVVPRRVELSCCGCWVIMLLHCLLWSVAAGRGDVPVAAIFCLVVVG